MRDVLLTVMDRVENAVLEHRGADVIEPLLDELARCCGEHFATGERVLRRYGYGDAGARSAMGERLLQRIPKVRERLRTGSGRTREVLNLLRRLEQKAGYGDGDSPRYHDSNGPLPLAY